MLKKKLTCMSDYSVGQWHQKLGINVPTVMKNWPSVWWQEPNIIFKVKLRASNSNEKWTQILRGILQIQWHMSGYLFVCLFSGFESLIHTQDSGEVWHSGMTVLECCVHSLCFSIFLRMDITILDTAKPFNKDVILQREGNLQRIWNLSLLRWFLMN